MKTKRELKWMLLLLLPIALIPATMVWQANRTSLYSAGGHYTDFQSGKRALGRLSVVLEEDSANTVQVEYSTPEDDNRWAKQVLQGTRPNRVWVYLLSYNRREKTLTKTLTTQYPRADANPSRTWVWRNVEEIAIHKIAAPIRKYFPEANGPAIDAYRGGKLEELQKYGATLTPPN